MKKRLAFGLGLAFIAVSLPHAAVMAEQVHHALIRTGKGY
jgi:hypothetical protein